VLDAWNGEACLAAGNSQDLRQSIWVTDAKTELYLETFSRLHPEYRSPRGKELLFRFDEARDSRAWKELGASVNKEDFVRDAVLVGQFETIAPRTANPRTVPGFGHEGAYTHELILIDFVGGKYNSRQ
jgi:hypothetical protein